MKKLDLIQSVSRRRWKIGGSWMRVCIGIWFLWLGLWGIGHAGDLG